MQPYFVPYLGYFQLLSAVDLFVIHDDVEYSKGGWVNRNRILLAGEPRFLTVALERQSDYARISDRRISTDYDCKKSVRQLEAAYGRAPYWAEIRTELPSIVCPPTRSLVEFNMAGLTRLRDMLGLTTPIALASEILPNADALGQRKVIDVCRTVGASEYLNAIGGMKLYSGDAFREADIKLEFLRSRLSRYPQGDNQDFVPALSVLDTLAWTGPNGARDLVLSDYEIIAG